MNQSSDNTDDVNIQFKLLGTRGREETNYARQSKTKVGLQGRCKVWNERGRNDSPCQSQTTVD